MVSLKEIKEAIDCSLELGDDELCFEVLNKLKDDPRLSDNFGTALAALIEHHGADALTSLAAVMRHYESELPAIDGTTISTSAGEIIILIS